MKKKITLKHIARELEVSISTVSKALKDSAEISKDTKEKIQAFAKLYNYRPNNIALSLKNRRTKNIGVIIPEIVHHFFATVIRGIEKYANNRGYNVIICVSNESFDKEVINMEMLANGSTDGFIMALSAETEFKEDFNHLREVMEQGMPLVLFDRVTNEIDCDKVVIDDREGAYSATKKLINNGNKRIALFTTENFFSVSSEREEGYKQALLDHNYEVSENLILKLDYIDMDNKPIEDFFDREKVDAVLCVNETFGIRAIRVVQEMGLKVPEDVSLIGFTNGFLSKYSYPSLTTVDQHGGDMGEKAAQMLIDRLESEDENEIYETKVLKSTLIERESTIN
ncbi:LacI family transcriptional regulator [Saonia flava]|uniref:LacI family transcriptional regulator n=1 Tax=Saonia flava TaxID=523696 RepID=A0A846R1K6_9FLAO|nr:LacI family DNA-binding transcriptional regulator [Saonia flava]NJB71825.1 LacI family transcriptional regulator [Saonia flava]